MRTDRSFFEQTFGMAAHRAAAATFVLAAVLGTSGCEIFGADRATAPDPAQGPQNEGLIIVDGEDYGLPAGVAGEPYSGYVDHPLRGDPSIGGGQRNYWTSWAALEPERGQYSWAALESALDQAEAGGYAISLHVHSITLGGYSPGSGITVANTVPDWVLEDFDISEDEQINLGWEFNLRVIPAWRPEIRQAFEDLIRAIGERGYPQRPGLGSAYVHGISPSRGEEFWLEPQNLADLEQAGLTPEVMRQWIGSRMAAYADAFGSHVHKLAWVGRYGNWVWLGAEYAQTALNLLHHAWELGIGNRNGGNEHYHRYLNAPAFGQAVDPDGYLTVDETIPPMASIRYFGGENESYGPSAASRFGGLAIEPHRYRFAMLRALQMRLRWLWTSTAAEQINPSLSEYARLSFGKTVENSPDAWAYLKEAPARASVSAAGVVRNFERWLLQRDVPGGMTVPADRVDRHFNSGAVSDHAPHLFYDLTARRTDLQSDNPYIYFDIDDRFQISGRALIKVEYRDVGKAAWRIEYMDAGGELRATPRVRNRDTGNIKTATFTVEDAHFAGGLPHGMDFRIVSNGPQDVTVRWVRIVRNR